ncbi:hypothetical protein EHP00_1050 [Ecytonucleospora hepatopenaei]|uniref:NOT2/NOT3/NOT5 C-terminal domain-containing protein n=1 Tax=Ecytonucleospora hepatopenaei TaxID=646526 RepID=A0A1W0E5E7_9MICR|nr:hypothetical protein EHP00_1050 [Ecytonucleospora hepatopenaei]
MSTKNQREQLQSNGLLDKKEEDIEYKKIIERIMKPNYFIDIKKESIMSRMMPKCYSEINTPKVPLSSFNEETLFYIFYAMSETEIQVEAFNEILSKGYVYSTYLDEFVFYNDEIKVDNNVKSILVFNPYKWEKENVEILFDSKFIDSLMSQKINILN